MNLQDILLPIRDLMVWSFETILESGLPGMLNWAVWGLMIVVLIGWLRMQKQYTATAQAEGGIV